MAPGGTLQYCAQGLGFQGMCGILDLVLLTCPRFMAGVNEISAWVTGRPLSEGTVDEAD